MFAHTSWQNSPVYGDSNVEMATSSCVYRSPYVRSLAHCFVGDPTGGVVYSQSLSFRYSFVPNAPPEPEYTGAAAEPFASTDMGLLGESSVGT